MLEWTTLYNQNFAYNLNSAFKLPYKTLMEIRFIFTKDLHISLTDFDNMEFFDILYMLDEYQEWVEKENKRNGEQQESYNAEMERVKSGLPDYNKMSNDMTKNMSSNLPNMSSMKMPSFNMPSFPT